MEESNVSAPTHSRLFKEVDDYPALPHVHYVDILSDDLGYSPFEAHGVDLQTHASEKGCA